MPEMPFAEQTREIIMEKKRIYRRLLWPLGGAGVLTLSVAMAETEAVQPQAEEPVSENAASASAPHLLDRKMELIMRLYNAVPDERKDPEILQQLDEAERLEQSGELFEAEKILNQTLQDVGKASRSSSGRRSSDRLKLRYEEKLTHYDSLWTAMLEILKEKQQTYGSVGNLESLQKRLERSKSYAQEGNYQQANNQIDHAYRMLSQSLSNLRDKETLQHRLVFESPKDEYDYEQRRYQTHQLLLEMTLAEKADPTKLTMTVDRMARAAEEQNLKAQDEAGREEYASAVKTQERATELLINALRQAGLYLPQ